MFTTKTNQNYWNMTMNSDRFVTDEQLDRAESNRLANSIESYFLYEQYGDKDGRRAAVMISNAKKVMEFEKTGRIKKRSAFGEMK